MKKRPRYCGPEFPTRAYARMIDDVDAGEEPYAEFWDEGGVDGVNSSDGPAVWVGTYKLISVRKVRRITKVVFG